MRILQYPNVQFSSTPHPIPLQEISEELLDKRSAYILFYEREGVEFSHFMPDTTGCEPDLAEIEDEFESDLKKMCVISWGYQMICLFLLDSADVCETQV